MKVSHSFDKTSLASVISAKIRESRTASSVEFLLTPSQLRKFVDVCSTDCEERLREFGGIEKLLSCLRTSEYFGLTPNEDELKNRRNIYGPNYIPPKPPIPFWKYCIEAMNDPILIILQVSALLLLILNLIPFSHKGEASYEWIEAIGIELAVVIVVLVTAINDHKREAQFRSLQIKIDQEHVFSTLRDGSLQLVKVSDLVVGDICFIKYGDIVPADGLIISCNDIKVDESSLTGESELVTKTTESNRVLLSGTQIMEGSGKYVIVAVGLNSQAGLILKLLGATNQSKKERSLRSVNNIKTAPSAIITKASSTRLEEGKKRVTLSVSKSSTKQQSPDLSDIDGNRRSILQAKLTKLAVVIGYAGLIGASFIVIVPITKFCVNKYVVQKKDFKIDDMTIIIQFLINGVALLAVCIPEGLPLAIAITLAYSVKRMLKDNNLVRHLDACETMGNATCICSDKTGTLTLNRMTVVQAYLLDSLWSTVPHKSVIPPYLLELLSNSISINTNYSSKVKKVDDVWQHIGNKTECALLTFLYEVGVDYESIREIHPEKEFTKVYTFNSVRKFMSTVIKIDEGYELYCKGAPEVIVSKCSSYITRNGDVQNLSGIKKIQITRNVVDLMGKHSLRTLAMAFRNLEENEHDWEDESSILSDMTLIGIVGIEDPLRPEVPEAIATCQRAGIKVIMVTGDNVQTATAIAKKCGILKPNDVNAVIDGATFNATILDQNSQYSQALFDKLWPRIKVLARSSPQDKFILVRGIINSKVSELREVVAVTGDGTNDGPALRKADVGFAMGIAGTDVAKEACDIILTDDNFNSIIRAVLWGRNVYDNVSKFIQFQLTVNLVASLIAIYGCIVFGFSPLRTIQMLWINLIMDTLASLSLATELPTDSLLYRKPYGRRKSLLSIHMIKFILGHGLMQIIVLFIVIYEGPSMFSIDDGIVNSGIAKAPTQHATIVFNTLVLMTLFNEINARRVHGEKNVLSGIFKNIVFCSIWVGSFTLQVLFVQIIPTIPGKGVQSLVYTVPLSMAQWGWCLFFGFAVLPYGLLINALKIPSFRFKRGKSQTTEELTDEQLQSPSKVLWLRGFNRVQTQMKVIESLRYCIDANKNIAARIASMIDVEDSEIRTPRTASEVELHNLIQKRKSSLMPKSESVGNASPPMSHYNTNTPL